MIHFVIFLLLSMLEMFYCDITDSGRVANLRHGTMPAQGFWWLWTKTLKNHNSRVECWILLFFFSSFMNFSALNEITEIFEKTSPLSYFPRFLKWLCSDEIRAYSIGLEIIWRIKIIIRKKSYLQGKYGLKFGTKA